MSDEISASAQEYVAAFRHIEDLITPNQLAMLRAHYNAPDRTVTATQLARAVGFSRHPAANIQYGRLASRICDFFNFISPLGTKLYVLVTFDHPQREWEWTMRPEVAQALEELGWVAPRQELSVLDDLERHRVTYETIPDETTREAVIRSRVGQGLFRQELIQYWNGCAVTGCRTIDVLRASHIKSWRDSDNRERLDIFNGLLLIPNLDVAFDLYLITFQDDGSIFISSRLDEESRLQLGINHSMSLRWIAPEHRAYLQQHRAEFFRRS